MTSDELPGISYNLPVILAIGYRVRSHRGTQFRQWATTRLSEYLVKGFTMDDERVKNPLGPGVPDDFDELLERDSRNQTVCIPPRSGTGIKPWVSTQGTIIINRRNSSSEGAEDEPRVAPRNYIWWF